MVDDRRYFDLYFAYNRGAGYGTMLHLHKDRPTAWRRPGKGYEQRYPLSCFFPPSFNWFSRLSMVEDQQGRIKPTAQP